MRRTYAYNSIIIGVLLGATVWLSANSVVLGVVVGLAVSVIGFIIIRLIENAISKGVDKAADSISNAYRRHKAKNAYANEGAEPAYRTTQFPTQEQTRRIIDDIRPVSDPGAPVGCPVNSRQCSRCGNVVDKDAYYCDACGSRQ